MQAFAHLARDERISLGIAAAVHIALFAALAMYDRAPARIAIPERMEVSLAEEVSLTSTAPDPAAAPSAAVAPELSSDPAPVSEPAPEPVAVEPVRAVVSSQPRPTASVAPRPQPTPTPTRRAGGSRIGADFLEGNSASDSNSNSSSSSANFGSAEAASLNSAISRQLKAHWSAPQGVDAELLVTIVRFRLNPDGSLTGNPSCSRQSGVTASNNAQKGLHCERAIRAVRLAAPFNLPEQFYDKWKLINSRFDRRL